jgi:hypothetical protein
MVVFWHVLQMDDPEATEVETWAGHTHDEQCDGAVVRFQIPTHSTG